ncbi:MAG: hypothetical protein H6625_06330 [Bdellovibrionaceae bacterium]|nr:hypothetical protein [Pseudobdellovibrionaceae bacterium]
MEYNKKYLSKEEAEKSVFDFVPKKFPLVVPETASNFVNMQKQKITDFKISDLVAQQSGVADIKRKQIELQVESEALERLKEVEERAYHEAYELGLIEGTEKAYQDYKEEIKKYLENMDELLSLIEKIKIHLVEQSEAQIVKLLQLIAEKIAMAHIEIHPEVILDVIRKVIEDTQTNEDVILKLSADDYMFIEGSREKLGKKLDFLKRVKLEVVDEIERGGCILETRYGAIDATIEQRLEKVWQAISNKMPRIKKEAE